MRLVYQHMIFSTLYTTLPHNLIKEKLIDLTERTFQREGSLTHCSIYLGQPCGHLLGKSYPFGFSRVLFLF